MAIGDRMLADKCRECRVCLGIRLVGADLQRNAAGTCRCGRRLMSNFAAGAASTGGTGAGWILGCATRVRGACVAAGASDGTSVAAAARTGRAAAVA